MQRLTFHKQVHIGDATILVTGHLAEKFNWMEMSPDKVDFHLLRQKQVSPLFSEFQMPPKVSRYFTNMKFLISYVHCKNRNWCKFPVCVILIQIDRVNLVLNVADVCGKKELSWTVTVLELTAHLFSFLIHFVYICCQHSYD